MQVTNHSNNKRKMKEELLEAIYGTVERLEQKVQWKKYRPKGPGCSPIWMAPAHSCDTPAQQYEQGYHKYNQEPSISESSQDPWDSISSIGLFAPSNAQTYEPFPEDESAKKKNKKRRKGFSL